MVAVAIAAFLLVVLAAHLVTRPLLLPQHEEPEEADASPAAELEKRLDRIRELDTDHATGKLSDEDYRELRARDTAEAAELLRAVRDGVEEPPAEDPEPVPDTVAERPEGEPVPAAALLEARLERRIAARRAALESGTCATCGTAPLAEDGSCVACGSGAVVTGGVGHG